MGKVMTNTLPEDMRDLQLITVSSPSILKKKLKDDGLKAILPEWLTDEEAKFYVQMLREFRLKQYHHDISKARPAAEQYALAMPENQL